MTIQQAGIIPTIELHHRLRIARELTDLDRQSFAREVGISVTAATNAEMGYAKPRELTLRAWSMRTGVDLQWLKTGEAPEPDGDGATVHPPGLEPGTRCLSATIIPLRRAA